ncbi:branched-chain amino acid ABC transporter permease [Thalassobaculum sp.]|jgi:branched-chain amino acid transport system permease protein|uniref:branched-chain amino acid ABC transporter permease n=1 Tax=Thalassobaculum sp. TaxID=2022740 RepID=UPI0032EE3AA6
METAVTILLDGLVFSSYLFLVSVGLTIIFGVMKILNVAHGSLYAWGAYTSAYLIGVWSEAGFGDAGTFLMIAAAALVVGCILGFVLERGLIQFMYARDEVIVVLATFATFLILEDVILLVFGVDPYFAYQPMAYLGSAELGGILRDVYSLTLIGLAAVVGIVLWIGLTRTRWGKLLAAVIHDRELSIAMGIDVTKVYVLTFMLGAVLGALGGAYVAPMVSVAPGFGVEVIVLSFAVVVIGGMGSIPGAAIGALVVGIARAIAVHKLPEVELFVVYGVMAVVLVFRPEGLFAPASARKI